MVGAFLGADPAAELAAASIRTDELLARVGDAEFESLIVAARGDGLDRHDVVERYGAATTAIEGRLVASLDDLTSTPRESASGLPDAVDALELAVDARGAVAEEFDAYFATMFDLRDAPPVELERLIRARATFESSVRSLTAMADDAPSLARGIDVVASDEGLRQFDAAVDDLIAASLAGGVDQAPAELSLATVTMNLDAFSAVYRAATESSETTFELLDAAADNVLVASSSVKADATSDIRRWYALAAVLTAATVLSAFLASRYIVRPLRGLRRAADGLRTNQDVVTSQLGGPAEVRTAAIAIGDAALHLDLVTRQARALAAGELEAGVLDEPAPGGLGTALQDAVGTLRRALSQHDEFRRRLADEAAHDGLTNLPNRNASLAQLTRSLARTTRSGSQLAVLFIDLDHFKDVNDAHGHQAGDVVLAEVAQRLVTHVREGDHVGRLGGDEFVVIAEPVHDIAEAVCLSERILGAFADAIAIDGTSVVVGASIGIALSDGRQLTSDELIRDADLAVYRAKATGRGGIEICDEELRKEHAEASDLESALRRAIDQNELVVHYQPIVDGQTRRLHALEALVRWQRPGFDALIPPDQFIGFAERTNLIVDIDCWVLQAVAGQIARWKSDPDLVTVPVSINTSRRHLTDARFVDNILTPLRLHGLEPSDIIVEVTESAPARRSRERRSQAAGAARRRCVDRDRRLRHGLHLAGPPSIVARRRAQDRPLVQHQRNARRA